MEEKKEVVEVKEVNPVATVEESTKEVVKNITEANTAEEYKTLIALFNLNQNKKNALRMIKLNGLQDKIDNQILERFDKRPDQMSNQELLEFLKAIENSIERSQKHMNEIEDKPMIQINQQTINVDSGVQGIQLDKDSKQKVLDLVASLMQGIGQQPDVPEQKQTEIIDATKPEKDLDEDIIQDDTDTVYEDNETDSILQKALEESEEEEEEDYDNY